MRLMLCSMSMLLAACATTDGLQHGQPVPEQVVIVKSCVAPAEIPVRPRTHLRAGMDQKQKTAAVLADISDFEKYALAADGKLRACAGAADGNRND